MSNEGMTFKAGLKLGILGGGQLARMLTLAAHKMGFETHIYSESSDDPAAQVTAFHSKNKMNDETALRQFIAKMDVVTFESEFLDAELLSRADSGQNKLFPTPELMGVLQDRKTQKELFDKYELPTSPWLNLENRQQLELVLKKLEFPLVLKKRRFGYDGYGTFVIKDQKAANTMIGRVEESSELAREKFIAEQFIPFDRELACIFARNRKGEVTHYPLVESLQKDSRCFWTKGPIRHKKFSAVAKKITHFLKKVDYVGVMGVEFFETQKGLLINEIAPRVHNSGHYTMDAFELDQFDLHLRAIIGAPVEIPKSTHHGFAMVNLLGESENTLPQWKTPEDVVVHWYGKKQNRPGRKMGHMNSVATSPKKALKKALKARGKVQL